MTSTQETRDVANGHSLAGTGCQSAVIAEATEVVESQSTTSQQSAVAPVRRRRHRQALKSKREADKQRDAELNPTFESRSCYCASLCSPLRADFCHLYDAVQLPLTSEPLGTWAACVRLIRLKGGLAGDAVECTLFHASLEDGYGFVALSYVWGSCHGRIPICVNGRQFKITKSLHAALVHLRHESTDTLLWVDALCIDQGNLPERTTQVEHMPQIYRAAAEVVAWLGAASHESCLAMDYIQHAFQAPDTSLDADQASAHSKLESLWTKPYWGRIWVVQELASAYRSNGKCSIRCGHQSVSFDHFRSFLGRHLAGRLYIGGDSVLRAKRLTNLSIVHEEKSFLEILSESASLASTDPRDRIYGIRGISPQYYRNKIPVDYTVTFQDVCKRVISTYIKKEKNLDILCQFKALPRHDQYPSWVRDLSNQNTGMSPSIHSASAGAPFKPTISNDILHAKGKCIGMVDLLKGPYKFPSVLETGRPWPEMPNIEKLHRFAFTALSRRHQDLSPKDVQDRFMNLVSGDRWRGAAKQDTNHPSTPFDIWNSFSQHRVSSTVDEKTTLDFRYFAFFFSPLIDRTVFTTASGDIGIGPANMLRDDIVCVLYGCSYCAILRRVKQGRYMFIGPAYVDGAMSGEFVRRKHDNAGRELADEQFRIC